MNVEPANHALGRSRGGWTTELHLGCERGRNPLSILITAGQRGDSPQFTPSAKSTAPMIAPLLLTAQAALGFHQRAPA